MHGQGTRHPPGLSKALLYHRQHRRVTPPPKAATSGAAAYRHRPHVQVSTGASATGPSSLRSPCVAVGATGVQSVCAVVGQPIRTHSKEKHMRTPPLIFEMKS